MPGLFSSMCGINVDGENHFVISPKVGGHFTYAKAEYKRVFGTVKSGWEVKDGKIVFSVEIPANCTADVILPNGEIKTVSAGEYKIQAVNERFFIKVCITKTTATGDIMLQITADRIIDLSEAKKLP